jgi:hypothetical protein
MSSKITNFMQKQSKTVYVTFITHIRTSCFFHLFNNPVDCVSRGAKRAKNSRRTQSNARPTGGAEGFDSRHSYRRIRRHLLTQFSVANNIIFPSVWNDLWKFHTTAFKNKDTVLKTGIKTETVAVLAQYTTACLKRPKAELQTFLTSTPESRSSRFTPRNTALATITDPYLDHKPNSVALQAVSQLLT